MYIRLTKILSVLLLAALCCCLCTASLSEVVYPAPFRDGATRNGMVRVRLSSLGNPASLRMTVSGSYTVNGQSTRTLESGSTITVQKSNGRLTLTANGKTTDMGTSFKLRRHATDGQNGIRIAQGRVPGNLYPGDFTFTLSGSTFYIIASIYVEDYLYGVLPYEMGDLSGLEALKAQAVAARTYTLRAMSNRTGSLYDVVDTTADQVYNGTPSGNANCKKAVDATKGIVAQNGASFTPTYYTASNGGQTESLKNAWGSADQAALIVKDDPFDLKNAASARRSFTVNAQGRQSNGKLDSLLNQKAAAKFGAGAFVTHVYDVFVHTPRYDAPSKLYTKLTFSVRYERNGQGGTAELTFDIFSELEAALSMSINSMKNELWTVEKTASGFTVSARRYGHGIGMSQRGAMQMAKEGYTYDEILGFYYKGCSRVQYTLTRSILSPVVTGQTSQEQVIAEQPAQIEQPDSSAAPGVLTARVTTPQGSLNLRKSPSDSAQVLLTVPQGEKVSVLEKGKTWCKVLFNGVTGHVMTSFLTFDAAKATPAPTKAPTKAPKATAKKETAAPKKTTPAKSATPVPTAAPGDGKVYAQVTTQQGSLKLRRSAKSTSLVLVYIPQFETVRVLSQGSKWTKVSYNGVTGYVMTQFLTIGKAGQAAGKAPAAQPTAKSTAKATAKATAKPTAQPTASAGTMTATVTTKSGSLYLRKHKNATAQILCSIPQGTVITLLSKGSAWCRVSYAGKTGFVMTKFLSFGKAAVPAASSASVAVKTVKAGKEKLNVLKNPVQGEVISPNGKKLNLRAACNPDARVLVKMPSGEQLTITAVGETWCAVEYENKKGYCMKEFLEYTLHE